MQTQLDQIEVLGLGFNLGTAISFLLKRNPTKEDYKNSLSFVKRALKQAAKGQEIFATPHYFDDGDDDITPRTISTFYNHDETTTRIIADISEGFLEDAVKQLEVMYNKIPTIARPPVPHFLLNPRRPLFDTIKIK